MTNDVPKRVVLHWDNPKLDNGWEGWWHVCEGANGPGIGWYVPEDYAQAEKEAAVAAEREACADILWRDRNWVPDAVLSKGNYMLWAASENIRARTPADEQAALEAVKREARNEGLREAAEAARSWYHNLGKGTPYDEIFALMEDTDDDSDV